MTTAAHFAILKKNSTMIYFFSAHVPATCENRQDQVNNARVVQLVRVVSWSGWSGGLGGRSVQDLKYFPLHFGVWLPLGPRQLISSTLLGQLQPDFLLSHQLFSTSPLVTAVRNPA